jgi:VanZ family protein
MREVPVSAKRLRYWFPALVWMGVIFLLSTDLFAASWTGSVTEEVLAFFFPSLRGETVIAIHLGIRKTAHVTVYALLSWFYLVGIAESFSIRASWTPRRALFTVLLCMLYALSDEWHQSFSPERTATLRDVAWDTLGAGLMHLVFRLRFRGGRSSGS